MSDERMDRPTARQIAHIKEAVDALVDGGRGFLWGPCHPEGGFASHEEVVAHYAEIVQMTAEANPERSRELWGVFVNRGDESLFVCHTGNGPKSEAHARFVAAAPWSIHALLAEIGALEAHLEECRESFRQRLETAPGRLAIDGPGAPLVVEFQRRADAAESERDALIKGLGFVEAGRDGRGSAPIYERGEWRVSAGGYDGWNAAREGVSSHFDGLGEALAHAVTEEIESLEARVEKLERDREDWRGSAGIWKSDHDLQKARADDLTDKLRSLVDAIGARNAARDAYDDFQRQWASRSMNPTSEGEWARNDGLAKVHRAAAADYEAALEAARGAL